MKKSTLFVLVIIILSFILFLSGCEKNQTDKEINKILENLTPTESLFFIVLVVICFFLGSISSKLKDIRSLLKDLTKSSN